MDDSLGDRVFEVRKALGDKRKPLSQEAFAALLTERGEKVYYGPDFSNVERNKKPLTLEDVAVIASVDPERRGKLWLGWGEAQDGTMAESVPRLRPGDVRQGVGVTVAGRGAVKKTPRKQA